MHPSPFRSALIFILRSTALHQQYCLGLDINIQTQSPDHSPTAAVKKGITVTDLMHFLAPALC